MKVIFLSLILIMGIQAKAAPVASTPKFIARFVQVLNDRLEKENNDRALKGGRLYCSQLSDEQISDMESLFITNPSGNAGNIVYRNLEKTTVGQFIAAAADQLNCYPTFWPTKGRSTIGGVLFNSKSFVMDTLILKEAVADLAGRSPDDNENLSQVFRP